jgi:hypothetical protein
MKDLKHRELGSRHLSMFGTVAKRCRVYSAFSARDIFAALGRLPGAPQSVKGITQRPRQ